ncbi:DUF6000 family protein [Undibacterium cyanobacteriorum]|uniref:DUF6000 family protein n=1 Tax=Undibacterium cyanobacteriorum TaxID=3073561 RepID=A0ABY9RIQ9_9BURK|nr:DUF6000 family protein [Undibacterium sp. 20NA77.5]WMW81108.1 DUF6000 family protein [Undibacterium sp. 20NA77.5]
MTPLQMHVAGATVQHLGPFGEIVVPTNTSPLSPEIRDKWVRPLYFGLRHDRAAAFVEKNLGEADLELVKVLLSHFDWRSRKTGAHLAAFLGLSDFEDQIGRLLLRSDVCYAGFGYCVAIAEFNTPIGVQYLNRYLDYYLKKPELFFDQNNVMAALKYLDEVNGTKFFDLHLGNWNDFVVGKQNWDLERSIDGFKEYVALFKDIKKRCET